MYYNDKIKNVHIDYARMERERDGFIHDDDYNYYFSFEKIRELLAMASEDIIPNGHYSDAECDVWSAMHSVLCNEGLKEWDV